MVWSSAWWLDSAALNSVQGNRLLPLPLVGGGASGGVGPRVGQLGEHRLLGSGEASTGIGFGWQAVGPLVADLGRDLVVGLVAAHVEVLDVRCSMLRRVGDGGGVEQADQLGEATRGRRCAESRW